MAQQFQHKAQESEEKTSREYELNKTKSKDKLYVYKI